ncbi:hypothetical protein ACE6H2_023619 [Prunus campanulata]
MKSNELSSTLLKPLSTLLPILSEDHSVLASNHPLNRRKRQRSSNQEKRSRNIGSSYVIKNHRNDKMKLDEPSSTLLHVLS